MDTFKKLETNNEEDSNPITQFYRSLILLSIIAPPQCFRKIPPPTPWHRLLDNLSLLCDGETGGKSVVSIAVEQQANLLMYWIATNGKKGVKASDHLRWVLELLQKLRLNPINALANQEEMLLTETIKVVNPKIKNYIRGLQIALRKVLPSMQMNDPEVKSLFDTLTRLLDSRHDTLRCCKLAYEFKKGSHISTLDGFAKAMPVQADWSLVRHYVGRLGCFVKAVRFLMRVGRRCPELFQSFDVTLLSAKSALESQRATDRLKNELVPVGSIKQIRNDEIVEAFSKKCGNPKFRPFVHAEVILLEYFYANGLQFFKDDRYIGCSKASCFCCQLYTQLHPGEFEPRPCHGNVWIKWSTSQRSEEMITSGEAAQNIYEMMTIEIQGAIDKYLALGLCKHMRLFDSTTDLSASIPSAFAKV